MLTTATSLKLFPLLLFLLLLSSAFLPTSLTSQALVTIFMSSESETFLKVLIRVFLSPSKGCPEPLTSFHRLKYHQCIYLECRSLMQCHIPISSVDFSNVFPITLSHTLCSKPAAVCLVQPIFQMLSYIHSFHLLVLLPKVLQWIISSSMFWMFVIIQGNSGWFNIRKYNINIILDIKYKKETYLRKRHLIKFKSYLTF